VYPSSIQIQCTGAQHSDPLDTSELGMCTIVISATVSARLRGRGPASPREISPVLHGGRGPVARASDTEAAHAPPCGGWPSGVRPNRTATSWTVRYVRILLHFHRMTVPAHTHTHKGEPFPWIGISSPYTTRVELGYLVIQKKSPRSWLRGVNPCPNAPRSDCKQ